ncbi:MAG: uracil-DNA glycosylase [Candidatus Lokiarchaeota archaeon]|nr:uracil-DNA glycosylase [Candidatus Lokiarchaeota archaeon]
MKKCYWYNVCPIKRFYEQGKIKKYWVEQYCMGDLQDKCVRKRMEENGKYHPDNMLPNGEIREDLK